MDPQSQITAADTTITLGGRTYRLAQLRRKDWGELRRVLAERRPRPIELAKRSLDGLSEPLQIHLLDRAYEEELRGTVVPDREVFEWLGTIDGFVYALWLSLRRAEPQITLDDAEMLVTGHPERWDELKEKFELSLGLPPGNPTPAQPQAIDPTTRSSGGKST